MDSNSRPVCVNDIKDHHTKYVYKGDVTSIQILLFLFKTYY